MTDVASLLPPNATAFEHALEATLARIGNLDAERIADLWNPWRCPIEILPWLAWSVGVLQWSSDWTEQSKRKACAEAIAIRRQAGTVAALRRALGVLDYTISVSEWWQQSPKGAPYTFGLDVEVTGKPVSDGLAAEVIRIATAAKNLRSHLSGVRLIGAVTGQLSFGSVAYGGHEVTVMPYLVTEQQLLSIASFGAATQISSAIQINSLTA